MKSLFAAAIAIGLAAELLLPQGVGLTLGALTGLSALAHRRRLQLVPVRA